MPGTVGKTESRERERVAIYCRLSEEDRDKQGKDEDSRSIENQKAMLIRYAAEKGWEISGIYSDDDYAGADRKRPEFNRLLEDAGRRRFDIVLCKTQSRFTREMELVERYIHGLFPIWNIRFVSVVDNADTAVAGNKKARQINGLVNEWYLEDMSDNIRSVLDSRRASGLHIGSFALYGYDKDPGKRGHLIVDPEAAAVVREIFSLYVQGYGKTAIARLLNEREVPGPTEYKRQKGLNYRQPRGRGSGLWSCASITRILQNEAYLGNMVQGRYGSVSYKIKQNRPRPRERWYIVEGTHEPIIDRAVWDRAQRLMSLRSKPRSEGTVGLFSGYARCAGCGYALRSLKSHGKSYLRCSSRYVGRAACGGAFVSVDRLEETLRGELDRLTETFLDREMLMRGLSVLTGSETERQIRLRREERYFRKKAQEYEAMRKRLYRDLAVELISEEEYRVWSREFEEKRRGMEEKALLAKRQLTGEGNTEDLAIRSAEGRAGRYEAYLHPDRLYRELAEHFIDCLEVGGKDPETGEIPVTVRWKF